MFQFPSFLQIIKQSFSAWLLLATKPMVGGQAVMEGVMMRSPKSFAVAVRKSDQSIVVLEKSWLSLAARFPFLKWPFVRGATVFVESMYNGLYALQFSAEQAAHDPQEEQSNAAMSKTLWMAMLMSMVFGIFLFKAIPHMLVFALGEWFSQGGINALPVTSVAFHVVDGVVRLSFFVGYLLLIGRFEDVKRLFMYHGAEHKVVHTFEKGLALDVSHAAKQPTAHPRCGTTLVLLVITISILVFMAVIPFLPVLSDRAWIQSLFSLVIKIPLMLPIAAIAYEFQRAAAQRPSNRWMQIFVAPGMWMQKLTTLEPTVDQLEVSLTALKKNLWRERQENKTSAEQAHIESYTGFADVCAQLT